MNITTKELLDYDLQKSLGTEPTNPERFNGMDDIRIASFVLGDNQVDIGTHQLMSGWMYYPDDIKAGYLDAGYDGIEDIDSDYKSTLTHEPGIEIRENGNLLYREASKWVEDDTDWLSNVTFGDHYEIFTDGQFQSRDEVASYLNEKYQDAQWEQTDKAAERQPSDTEIHWTNPEYQKRRDLHYEYLAGELTRLAVKDLGPTTKGGNPYHKVMYEYACDQKVFGEDKPMADPAVKKTPYMVPDEFYKKMMKFVNPKGCEGSDYAGVLLATVENIRWRYGKTMKVVRAINDDFSAVRPREPFDIAKHKEYIAKSKAYGQEKSNPTPEKPDKELAKQQEQGKAQPTVSPESLTRIVVKDFGEQKNPAGKLYHKVDFAYACDQMKVGVDKPMASPYVSTSERKLPDGDVKTTHSMYLSDAVYDRLQSVLNKDGCNGKNWDGVYLGTTKKHNGSTSPDLTKDAFANGKVQKPDVPFDEKKHDSFVKASQDTVHAQRIADLESSLPSFDTSLDTGMEFGD